ncbi:hypothetical protein [Bdellovibrio sp. HCB337]|uniref:hypothetical protein n=1 Tax=Bdellovibrio sp. HCB337 TaxID=3394358 RepID=UPI0039A4B48F
MKYALTAFLLMINLACANAKENMNLDQSGFDSYELGDVKLKDLSFDFEIENPEGVARIIFDQSVNLVERKYLVRGEELLSSQFANNLYDFSCGLQSYFLPTHTPVLRDKIIKGQMKFELSRPQFGTSYVGNYVLDRFVFPLEKKGDLLLVCYRHYVQGSKTTVHDLKAALSGYLKVRIVP